MGYTVRVSLPGQDSFASSDARNFSLIADADNVLLKESARGSLSSGGSFTHSLGYIPFYLTYGDVGGSKYQLATGFDAVSGIPRCRTTPNILKTAGGDMKYFVFYDNMN